MAVYNPYQQYPQNYSPSAQAYYQPPQINDNSGMIWVQGESGAKAYPVQSGRSVVLFDSESEHFFIKTTDPSGMPQPLRIFSYKESSENEMKTPEIDTSNFITRQEFEEAINRLSHRQNNHKNNNHNNYQRKDVQKNGKPII